VQGGVGYGPESSKNFNNTQHVFFSQMKDIGENPAQELEIFSDQTRQMMLSSGDGNQE
jgi:hypothetical protein|tara:strand:- start:318 stop:491 length:174 start_codon:yes stop_codon:yes gene_type:complete